MLYFVILLITISLVYNIYALVLNKGALESISSTSYLFLTNGKKHYYFTIYCFAVAFILLPIWLTVSAANAQFLVFLTCCGIVFAGTTPLFKEKFQGVIHYTAGALAVLCYLLWMIFSKHYIWLIAEAIVTAVLIAIDYKNFVYYTEIVGLFTLLVLLLVLLI